MRAQLRRSSLRTRVAFLIATMLGPVAVMLPAQGYVEHDLAVTGSLQLTTCSIASTCEEPALAIQSIPVTWSTAGHDTCALAADSPGAATGVSTCSIQDGRNGPGHAAASLIGNCGPSGWTIAFDEVPSGLWWRNASRELYRLAGRIDAVPADDNAPGTWNVAVTFDRTMDDYHAPSLHLLGVATGDCGGHHLDFVLHP